MTPPPERDFSALARKAGALRGAPAPLVPAEDPAEPAAVEPAQERSAAHRPRPAPPPVRRRVGRPAGDRDAYGRGLPAELAARMRTAAIAAGLPYGDWLMDALDRTWERQEEVYPPLPTRRPELPPARRTPRRSVPGGRVSINFRLTAAEAAAIAARQNELGVTSDSEFVTTVVALGLGDQLAAAVSTGSGSP